MYTGYIGKLENINYHGFALNLLSAIVFVKLGN